LVDIILGYAQNSFETWQAAACRSLKEFCENLGNMPANRKTGVEI
jgi:hypothetical protein